MKPLRRPSLLSFLLALAPCIGAAHPGPGIVVDSEGRVCFTSGGRIVAIDTAGIARIILHDPQNSRFYQLHHLFVDAERNLYTAADTGTGIWKVSPNDKISRFFPPPNKDRSVLVGLGGDPFCLDQAGNVFAINSQ